MKTRTFIAIALGVAAVSFIGCSTPRKLAGSTKETAKTEEKRNETTAAEFRPDGRQYENRRRRSNLYENRVFPAETRYPAGKARTLCRRAASLIRCRHAQEPAEGTEREAAARYRKAGSY